MYEYVFNTTTGKASHRVLNDVVGDFPVVPASLVGTCVLCVVWFYVCVLCVLCVVWFDTCVGCHVRAA